MKCFALVHSGLEKLALKEVQELISNKPTIYNGIIEFSVKKKEDVLLLLSRMQSVRRLLISMEEECFFPNCTFKVDVENVKGIENRIEIAKRISEGIYAKHPGVSLNFKHPDLVVVVYVVDGKEYIGVDAAGKELHRRDFRLFPHAASFTGDTAYAIARAAIDAVDKLGHGPLLVGFCKDGAIAIEAALFLNHLPVRDENWSCLKFPVFNGVKLLPSLPGNKKVFAFDESTPNVTAAKKNAKLAGVADVLDVQKRLVDDLDVRYGEEQFGAVIFHLTKKNKDKINEIYHQAYYILKKKGKLLLVTRGTYELSISDRFPLLSAEEIVRGESSHKLWVLEKK